MILHQTIKLRVPQKFIVIQRKQKMNFRSALINEVIVWKRWIYIFHSNMIHEKFCEKILLNKQECNI